MTRLERCRWFGSAEEFIHLCAPASIDRLVGLLARLTPKVELRDRGEVGSWTNSLPRVAQILQAAGLTGVYVILEYNPYQAGSSRVDVILAGASPTGHDTYVVLELKQWSSCELDPVTGKVHGTGSSYERDGLTDPYEQARVYATFIRNYTGGMHDEAAVRIHPAAYLHNCSQNSARSLLSRDWETDRHVFVGDSEGQDAMIAQLRRWLAADGAHEAVGRRLLEAGYQQAPALLEVAGEILTNPERYPMSDEQRRIHDYILLAVQRALAPAAERSRALLAIKGGPGTGKTWIAMHLLGSNARAGRQVSYATNSTSLRAALKKRAREGLRVLDRPVDSLVTSARTYWHEARWATPLDVLIVDEGQRITTYTVRSGHANARVVQQDLEYRNITQLFELMKSCKVLVSCN